MERSITADRLIEELHTCFAAAGGPPLVLRMDNGPELISQALQSFCAGQVGLCYIPPGTPWNNGYIESFNNRLRRECLNRNHWTSLTEASVVIGDFKHEHNHRHRHSALGLPHQRRAVSSACFNLTGDRSLFVSTSGSLSHPLRHNREWCSLWPISPQRVSQEDIRTPPELHAEETHNTGSSVPWRGKHRVRQQF